MFILVGNALPDRSSPRARATPIFRVYKAGPKKLPPLFIVRARASLIEDDDIDVPMPAPSDVGVYAIASVLFDITKILRVSASFGALSILNTPVSAGSFSTWSSGRQIHALLPKEFCTPGASMTLQGISSSFLPIPDSDSNFLLDLSSWGAVTPEVLWSKGMLFKPAVNPSTPRSGEFTSQGSGIYKLFADGGTAPQPYSVVDITFSVTIRFEAIATYAVFEFSANDLVTLESIEYLGRHFKPAADVLNPRLEEFFYSRHRAVLFLNLGLNIAAPTPSPSTSTISSFSYTGIVN